MRNRNTGERSEFLATPKGVYIASKTSIILNDQGDRKASEGQPNAPGKAKRSLDCQAPYPRVVY